MQKSSDILKLRTLLCFLSYDEKECTVTKIARTLGEEKYAISRVLQSLQREGFVNRENPRNPHLTRKGEEEVNKYANRIRISMNHLMYEGLNVDSAEKNALYWALYNTDDVMDIFQAADERYRVKYEMSHKKRFSGAELCSKMKDGVYQFPFLIYKEHIDNGNHISWANEGFEHPCSLRIKNGVGTIHLRTKVMIERHPKTGEVVKGYAKSLKYLELGEYVSAEYNGTALSFPASAVNFLNIGSGVGQILHGSVCVRLGSFVGNVNRPEFSAVFTILI